MFRLLLPCTLASAAGVGPAALQMLPSFVAPPARLAPATPGGSISKIPGVHGGAAPPGGGSSAQATWLRGAHTPGALGRGISTEKAESMLLDVLSSTSATTAARYSEAETLHLPDVATGEPAVSTLLNILEADKPRSLDQDQLKGEWSLEYTSHLPAEITEEVARHYEEGLTGLSLVLTISDAGTMHMKAVISLLNGDKKVMHMHSPMKQEQGSLSFSVFGWGGDSMTMEVTYSRQNILVMRQSADSDHEIYDRVLEGAGLSSREPAAFVWKRVDESSSESSLTAAPISLWRFGIGSPYLGPRSGNTHTAAELSDATPAPLMAGLKSLGALLFAAMVSIVAASRWSRPTPSTTAIAAGMEMTTPSFSQPLYETQCPTVLPSQKKLAVAAFAGETSRVPLNMTATSLREWAKHLQTSRRVSTLDKTSSGVDMSWRTYNADWEVHKFGGASLETAQLYKTCGDLLLSQAALGEGPGGKVPTAAIVSAAGGMTDALVGVVNAAAEGDTKKAEERLEDAVNRQKGILLELVPDRPDLTDPVIENLQGDRTSVLSLFQAASMLRGVPPQMMELVAGLGEVWSAQTLAAYMSSTGNAAGWVDARDVLIVPDLGVSGLGEKGTVVDTIEPLWDETAERLQQWWGKTFESTPTDSPAPFLIITGFVCSTTMGRPTTLKRSGSDYSATIFAKVLGSAGVTFWKNVSGVYTADPRMVPKAFSIPTMTFDEAMELAYFGGQVLHPSAMVPCIEGKIPVKVKNVFDPSHPGTRVYGRGAEYRWDDQEPVQANPDMPVTALTSIEKISLVTLAGASFMGTRGVAERMMSSLASAGVNVILTSQGSSEHSITVAVAENEGEVAAAAVREGFQMELARNEETSVRVRHNLSILAVIGEGMKSTSGIAGRFFNALAQAKVSVVAIAQGASERNISVVVERSQLSRSLQAAHAGFVLSDTTVAVALVGTGVVGTQLVHQIAEFMKGQGRNKDLPAMKEVNFLDLEVHALADKERMLLSSQGIPLESLESLSKDALDEASVLDLKAWQAKLEASGKSIDDVLKTDEMPKGANFQLDENNIDDIIKCLETKNVPHKVVIDCTASDELAEKYPEWLKRGLHIVTPNKKASSGPLARYKACLQQTGRTGGAIWDYESTCGGQLPVISVIHDLLQSGDNVEKIEGVLSGSLSFILNELYRSPEMKLSEAVEKATEMGLTEPDAAEDLNGCDTVRKAVILARELGMQCEVADVKVEAVPNDDDAFAEKLGAARAKQERLFYVAKIDNKSGTISVGLKTYPEKDPPFVLRDAETVLLVTTQRNPAQTPLVVRGLGAGPVVTASGVFAGLMRLSKRLS